MFFMNTVDPAPIRATFGFEDMSGSPSIVRGRKATGIALQWQGYETGTARFFRVFQGMFLKIVPLAGAGMRELPAIVERYWYSIDWDVEALWAMDLPVESVPAEILEWHLDVPVWPDPEGRPYRVTPAQVIEKPEEHPEEHARIQAADLAFPLAVFENRGRLMILDGIHRLCKAILRGDRELRARRIPREAVEILPFCGKPKNFGN